MGEEEEETDERGVFANVIEGGGDEADGEREDDSEDDDYSDDADSGARARLASVALVWFEEFFAFQAAFNFCREILAEFLEVRGGSVPLNFDNVADLDGTAAV